MCQSKIFCCLLTCWIIGIFGTITKSRDFSTPFNYRNGCIFGFFTILHFCYRNDLDFNYLQLLNWMNHPSELITFLFITSFSRCYSSFYRSRILTLAKKKQKQELSKLMSHAFYLKISGFHFTTKSKSCCWYGWSHPSPKALWAPVSSTEDLSILI